MLESSLLYERTEEERADQKLSWERSDKAFFASGACHILASLMKEQHPDQNYEIIFIEPHEDFGNNGSHVYVRDGRRAFDFNGWSDESELLKTTEEAYGEKYPGWQYEKIVITDDLEAFCHKNNHRLPESFYQLPWERAFSYIEKMTNSMHGE